MGAQTWILATTCICEFNHPHTLCHLQLTSLQLGVSYFLQYVVGCPTSLRLETLLLVSYWSISSRKRHQAHQREEDRLSGCYGLSAKAMMNIVPCVFLRHIMGLGDIGMVFKRKIVRKLLAAPQGTKPVNHHQNSEDL